jgi:serine/threonine-protein kinase
MPFAPDLSGSALDDRYELHAVIGEGAFGRVYRGLDRRLDRPVAVKVIKPWWTDDPGWAQSFEREARLLASISDPGIVQIYDVGHAPEGRYYVSELVDGENLARHLRSGPLPPWQACAIAAQLSRALAHAHGRGIVHRDVKPANVLLSRRGQVKVADFGVARLAEGSTDDGSATIVGTPRYMAPEQGQGMATTPATDVYSVGAVLYEMLSGQPPFMGVSPVELALAHLQDPPPPLPPRLPESLVAIAERALAKDPAARFADGGEMADALVAARRGSAVRPRRAVTARSREVAHASLPPTTGSHATALLDPPAAERRRGSARVLDDHGAAGDPPSHDRTRRAPPPPSPRRDVDPPGRRRAIGLLAMAAAVIGALVIAAGLIGGHAVVPGVTHLREAAAVARVRARHLRPRVVRRYSRARSGTVTAERPAAGTTVSSGAEIRLTVSKGPPPVEIPVAAGATTASARATFARLGLHTKVIAIPAPGTTPGTVVHTHPAATKHAPVGSSVTLYVAEVPRWRPVTTVSGTTPTTFTIHGTKWRIVYRMSFHGTCTWIFFCSGPHATVTSAGGAPVAAFGLDDGGSQTRTFTGAGTYRLQVTRGGDTAGWSLQVQDDY